MNRPKTPPDGTRLGVGEFRPLEEMPPEPTDQEWEDLLAEDSPLKGGLQMPKVGDTLGSFRLDEFLAEGGMGVVYRATHIRLERPVAVKVLDPALTDRMDLVHRFFKEAQAVNRIRHPNIVDITDFVEGGQNPPYMVMELLEGQSLSTYIKENAPVTPQVAVAIGRQLCNALAAVHETGIVHRDLKPDNIYLLQNGKETAKLKLLDFGVAKFMAAERVLETRPGEMVGTPEYMAPEQVRGTGVDHRIDVYAAGLILYELLTGQQPFAALELPDLLNKQLHEDAAPPSFVLPFDASHRIPHLLDEVILRCLVKDPDDRVQNMDELGLLLKRAMEEDEDGVQELLARARKGPGPWLWIVAGISALAVLGGVIGWAVWPKAEEDKPPPRRAEPVAAAMQSKPLATASTLRLESRPGAVAVYRLRDGKFLGLTPLKIPFDADRPERLLLRKNGYLDLQMTVERELGNSHVAKLKKKPEPMAVVVEPKPEKKPKVVRRTRRRSRPMTRPRRRRPRDTSIVDPFE